MSGDPADASFSDTLTCVRNHLAEGTLERAAEGMQKVLAWMANGHLTHDELSTARLIWAECERLAVKGHSDLVGAVRRVATGRTATSRYGSGG